MQNEWMPYRVSADEWGVRGGIESLLEVIDKNLPIEDLLMDKRAVRFSGFRLGRADFELFVDRVCPDRLSYVNGNSPRTHLGNNTYTSTEYSAKSSICLHNELSYSSSYPTRLAFFCERPSRTGGATPVADGSAFLAELSSEILDCFSGGLRYTQNLHGGRGFGRSWQETYQTDSKKIVEEYLGSSGSEWEWAGEGIRVVTYRPSWIKDPRTGLDVWFNQADQWHPESLPLDTRKTLLDLLPADKWPLSVSLPDGADIPSEYIREILETGWKLAKEEEWYSGDVLLVDNLLALHGRRPYEGDRRILVAMQ